MLGFGFFLCWKPHSNSPIMFHFSCLNIPVWNILYSDQLKFYHVLIISVAEILELHGEWIEATPFAELVSKRQKITVRHAYNKIKKVFTNNEILRVQLPNRRVLYGLPKFGWNNAILAPEETLRNLNNIPSKWKKLKEIAEKFGGYLLDLEHQKLKLGDRDPETGWPKENYDQVLPIQGIIVLKGATDLAAAIKIIIPEKYDAFIFTPSLVNEVIRPDDQIYWRDKRKLYKVKKIDKISDPYETSYVILKVVKIRII